MKPQPKSIAQVLIELAAYPLLSASTVQDRQWLWIAHDLSGSRNHGIREAIGKQGIGFRFAPKGHTLPDGRVAHWGHSCERPVRFTPKGKRGPEKQSRETDTSDISDADLLAALA